jgi:hypothetical protein
MTQELATNGSAMAVRDAADLAPRFVISLDALKRQLQELEQFKREIMIEGEDYGVIPGTPKPTLFKPGAEKLTLVFGLAPTFVNVGKVEDWEGGFFHYEEECRLTSKRTGQVVASASGSANTKEAKHRYRKAERVCPLCKAATIIKGKEEYGGGWLCWKKNGGCGVKFAAGDAEIETQQTGNIENPEPYDLVNTIKKMAQKRALVASVLIATGGSGVWTQDIGEDMPSVAGERQVIDVTPSQPTPARRATPQAPARPPRAAPPELKVTDTKCSVCPKMVENESVLRDSERRFGVAFCVAHINEALDQVKRQPEQAEELPL